MFSFLNAQVIGKTVPMSGNSEIQIKCILFDIGGVLTSDIWETLLLTPVSGLADRLGLNRQIVQQAADVEPLLINNISTGRYESEPLYIA